MDKQIVVLGLGNLLATDEGFGIHALRQLKTCLFPEVAVTEFDGDLLNFDSTPDEDLLHTSLAGDLLSNIYTPSDRIQFADGGILGLNLLPLVESCTHLLVLDAIDAGCLPGTLVELTGEQLPLYATQKLSEHQVGFQEILALARFRGHFPAQLHVIGVQPADLSGGIKLSPQVNAALDQVVERAREILQKWE